MALSIETPMVAVTATMGKAKLLGLVVDKVEATGKDGAPLMSEPPARDLARAVIDILRSARTEGAATSHEHQVDELAIRGSRSRQAL
jgi:hypothetical protein